MAVLQRLQAAARELIFQEDTLMSQPDLRNELATAEVEPLLPIEKKLIGWSFGLGIVLLVILLGLNHFVPIKI
jgi:hypothetical protein